MSEAIGVAVTGGSEDERAQITQFIAASLDEGGFCGTEVVGFEGVDKPTSGSILSLINENHPELVNRTIRVVEAHSFSAAQDILARAEEESSEEQEEENTALADV